MRANNLFHYSILLLLLILWLKPINAQIGQNDSIYQVDSLIKDTNLVSKDSLSSFTIHSYALPVIKVVHYKDPYLNKEPCRFYLTPRVRPRLCDLHSFDEITLNTLVSATAGVQYIHSFDSVVHGIP